MTGNLALYSLWALIACYIPTLAAHMRPAQQQAKLIVVFCKARWWSCVRYKLSTGDYCMAFHLFTVRCYSVVNVTLVFKLILVYGLVLRCFSYYFVCLAKLWPSLTNCILVSTILLKRLLPVHFCR